MSEETAGDFVTRLGVDGSLWAKELHKAFPSISEADALGWCCNMIMAGYDHARGVPINGDHAQYLSDKAALLHTSVSQYHDAVAHMKEQNTPASQPSVVNTIEPHTCPQCVANKLREQCRALGLSTDLIRENATPLSQPSEDKPCPHVYTSKDGTSHCTLAERDATELTRLRQQVEVLRGALRSHVIATSFTESGLEYDSCCYHCDGEWPANMPENHKDGCLASPAAADRIARGEA